MQPLFRDDRKYAYVLILTLALSSVFLFSRPTGMVTSVSSNALVDMAFSSETVRNFAVAHPDFSVIVEELTQDKLASLREAHPQLYANLPDVKIYQMILVAKDKALIILLNKDAVFKTLEVDLALNKFFK